MSKTKRNTELATLREENQALVANFELLQEHLAALELQFEDNDWIRLSMETDREFSRDGLRKLITLSRIMWLKNPLINRGVNVKAYYVWAQGINVEATDPAVNDVVQAFLDDPDNRVELTGHQARTQKEVALQVEGNIFFAFFTDAASGRVRVRTIPVDEITDIVTNPDDRREVWFYKRQRTESRFNLGTGGYDSSARTTYYPDWRYVGRATSKPTSIGGAPVEWDVPVYHLKVGGLPDMRFGVPETYQGIDWARAYGSFLEDRATLAKALSKFAWIAKTPGGAKAIAATKAKLATTVGTAMGERNPPPVTGSTAIMHPEMQMDPVKLAGATIHPDEGRRFLLMVAAAAGLPETFYGDASVGTLATAKSLDRPTELMCKDRQTLWADVWQDILDVVVEAAIRARKLAPGVDRHIDVDFPPLLERDVVATVTSIIDAATLKGQTPAGTMDDRTLVRLLLRALGVDQIDELLELIAPEDGESLMAQMRADKAEMAQAIAQRVQPGQGDEDDQDEEDGQEGQSASEAMMVEAVRELREALKGVIGNQTA
jgi:hypothetical protein